MATKKQYLDEKGARILADKINEVRFEEMPYEKLLYLYNSSSLVPGKFYCIPDYNLENPKIQLIVHAVNIDCFDTKSILYYNGETFNVTYDISGSSGVNNLQGLIRRMQDSRGNEATWDFVSIPAGFSHSSCKNVRFEFNKQYTPRTMAKIKINIEGCENVVIRNVVTEGSQILSCKNIEINGYSDNLWLTKCKNITINASNKNQNLEGVSNLIAFDNAVAGYDWSNGYLWSDYIRNGAGPNILSINDEGRCICSNWIPDGSSISSELNTLSSSLSTLRSNVTKLDGRNQYLAAVGNEGGYTINANAYKEVFLTATATSCSLSWLTSTLANGRGTHVLVKATNALGCDLTFQINDPDYAGPANLEDINKTINKTIHLKPNQFIELWIKKMGPQLLYTYSEPWGGGLHLTPANEDAPADENAPVS